MTKSIAITRTDYMAAELRDLAGSSDDGAQVRRLLALALTLEGRSRTEAAEQCGMQRQTLRDWVHRYNAEGIAGLITRGGPDQPPALSDQQVAELQALVIKGPDPEKHDVVRWRCVDLRQEVSERFTVEVHERTIGKWLRKLKLTRLQPRPVHPKKDPDDEVEFKKEFSSRLKAALLSTTSGTPIEIWFQDEARVGQQGTHAYMWAPIGSRPLMVRDNRHYSV